MVLYHFQLTGQTAATIDDRRRAAAGSRPSTIGDADEWTQRKGDRGITPRKYQVCPPPPRRSRSRTLRRRALGADHPHDRHTRPSIRTSTPPSAGSLSGQAINPQMLETSCGPSAVSSERRRVRSATSGFSTDWETIRTRREQRSALTKARARSAQPQHRFPKSPSDCSDRRNSVAHRRHCVKVGNLPASVVPRR